MKVWNKSMSAVQFRIARPTHQMDKIIEFYQHGLGLEIVASFQEHEGYDGVMFGLPNVDYHLEFTQYKEAIAAPPPTKDNLLVFYIPDLKERNRIMEALHEMGYPSVTSENPYWATNGITIEDPDGWRIVLQHSSGLS